MFGRDTPRAPRGHTEYESNETDEKAVRRLLDFSAFWCGNILCSFCPLIRHRLLPHYAAGSCDAETNVRAG